jgi:hypothetical protein
MLARCKAVISALFSVLQPVILEGIHVTEGFVARSRFPDRPVARLQSTFHPVHCALHFNDIHRKESE